MEDIGLLKRIEFFSDLNTLELTSISKLSERASYKAGETVVSEGEPCDAIYIVKDGSVRVMKADQLLITLDAGSPVGEISFVDKGFRSATVVADTDSTLVRLRVPALEDMLKKDKDLSIKVYRAIAQTLCQRLRDANETLLLLSD